MVRDVWPGSSIYKKYDCLGVAYLRRMTENTAAPSVKMIYVCIGFDELGNNVVVVHKYGR